MRYGSKVLFEDVSTTFTAGRRYGLTGPNGAGKSTFMKLLTGELPPQKGTVARPTKLGVLQAGSVRLRPVPRDRHGHHGEQAAVGRARRARVPLRQGRDDRSRWHAPRRARGHRRRGRRLLGRKRRRDPAAGPRHPRRAALAQDVGDPGRTESARAAGAGALRASAGAAARRADQPPGPRLDPLAAQVSRRVRRDVDRHLARPSFPQRGVHAHRGHRLPDHHHVHRRVRRHGAGQDADPLAPRGRHRAAREEDRAAQRLHRALFGRHALEPGAVAAQGSRTAANRRPRAVQHPAPLHPLPDGAALGPHGARVQGRQQGVRRRRRSSPSSARS